MPPSRAPRQYALLTQALLALPAAQTQVQYSFAELETLLGAVLPAAAEGSDFWTSSPTALRRWQRAGWQARLHPGQHAVTFTRR